MKKQSLRGSDIKKLSKEFNETYNLDIIDKKDKIETIDIEDKKILLKNNKPIMFLHNKDWIPTLKLILEIPNVLKKITVDAGAVKFIVNGADIMRPGITTIDENIKEGEYITIIEETHNKPLAVGKALFNTEEMKLKESGKVIENLHYVGDTIWSFE